MKQIICLILLVSFLIIRGHAFAAGAVCASDINQSGFVDLTDYSILAINFLKIPFSNPKADISGDGKVDLADYSLLVTSFLQPVNCPTATPTTPPNISNLFLNGDFEQDLTNWNVPATGSITNQAYQGNKALHVTSGSSFYNNPLRRSIPAGKTYKVTYWMKFDSGTSCTGDCWGGYSGSTDNPIGQVTTTGVVFKTPSNRPVGQWFKESMTITNTGNSDGSVQILFGAFSGSGWSWDVSVDDVKFFEVAQNSSPILNPSADKTAGNSPFTVQFTANADDYDGTISVYRWNFGDGSSSGEANPSHVFASQGTYTTTLTVTDDNGAQSTKSVQITVTGTSSPSLSMTLPTNQSTFSTSNPTLTLAGTASTSNGQISSLVWDNVNTGTADTISISPAQSLNWSSGNVSLKPGTNEFLVTVTDSTGKIATRRLVVTRLISQPSVSNISVNTTTPKVYEKYEVSFDASTVADYPLFMFDTNLPPNAQKYNGVTVEGVITLPNGQQVTQPAFFMENATKSGSRYLLTGQKTWRMRYAPQVTGAHRVALRITDKSGSSTTEVGTFTATAASKPGYVQVAKQDTRYFEFSNGSLYWPIGMTGSGGTIPESGTAPSIINYDRPWLGGYGAYSTNWARWVSSAEKHGNEGYGSHFSYTERYPSSELSQYIHYPTGFRMWIPCWMHENSCGDVQANSTYKIVLRVKTVSITGPRAAGKPYGLMLKNHGWLYGEESPSTVDQALASTPRWIPFVSGTNDWHTVVNQITYTGSGDNDNFSLYLENVTGGEAFIDYLSVRKVNSDGSLGPELIMDPKADLHTYVEQKPMAAIEDNFLNAEANGIYLRAVVHDKNDPIINHLSNDGYFVTSGSGGYYQPENSKATWLKKQWWRYLVARLGYSTSVFGWELNNEGPPDDGTGTHARDTQIFAKWMHDIDAHPHLANTSFWCCWRPTFWNNSSLPDINFGDIHHYGTPTNMVQWYLDEAIPAYNSHIGKPVVRAETGIDSFNVPSTSNTGVFYHNMLWSQLHVSSMFDIGYWYTDHFKGFSRTAHAQAFANFVKDSELNKGGYVDAEASSSNTQLLTFGQRNLGKNRAHLWVHNIDNTWQKVYNTGAPAPVNGTITLTMNPSTNYLIEYYNTYNGTVTQTLSLTSNSSGVLSIAVSNISTDIAIKIRK